MVTPNFVPHMPSVDSIPDIAEMFVKARELAGKNTPTGRAPVVLTPGHRILFPLPSVPPNTQSPEQIAPIERIAPRDPALNITVIALNTVETLMNNGWMRSIPFAGYLMGLAYIGHNVVITEGHSSALPAACDQTDLLIVDGGMVPFLQSDWLEVAKQHLRSCQILIFGRDGKMTRIEANATTATQTQTRAVPLKKPWWKLW
jgi:hypothetical protein